jgi:dihydropyrimidinase
MKILIKKAFLALPEETLKGDILINNGVIAAINADIKENADRIIDAEGLYLLPGGVDAHTHMGLDTGKALSSDTFTTGSRAALFGGTTTIVDHMGFGRAEETMPERLAFYHGQADGKTYCDYSFHGVIKNTDETTLNAIPLMKEEGISSFKIYSTYNYGLDTGAGLLAIQALTRHNALTCIHCEDDSLLKYCAARLAAEGKLAPQFFGESRPAEAEAATVAAMLYAVQQAGKLPLYIVHLSSRLSLEQLTLARAHGNHSIYAETCPQYLFLTDSHYKKSADEALKYTLAPPLRSKTDCEALWQALRDDTIQTVATDHCPFFFDSRGQTTDKQAGRHDFRTAPCGLPGVELRMPLLFSEGVLNKRLSLQRMIKVCCENPAKLFGLYPRKGHLAVGADADMVLFNPDGITTVQHAALHENTDYTPYEGLEVKGKIVMTLLRGQIVVENNLFKAAEGYGEFIKRHTPLLTLQ